MLLQGPMHGPGGGAIVSPPGPPTAGPPHPLRIVGAAVARGARCNEECEERGERPSDHRGCSCRPVAACGCAITLWRAWRVRERRKARIKKHMVAGGRRERMAALGTRRLDGEPALDARRVEKVRTRQQEHLYVVRCGSD